MIKTSFGVFFTIALSMIMTLVLPNLFLPLRILYVVPPCIFALYIFPPRKALWTAFFLGCFLDALQFSPRFGMIGLCFLLSQILLLRIRRFFFSDLLSTLFILTFIFSSFSTLLKGVFVTLLGYTSPFTISWILSDICFMPFVDAVFAFVCFSLPLIWFHRRRTTRGDT